ncbi:MAG TPA: glycosyltransferase [Candidatus Kapabacteria bacterium]|nr:glycosyltransferase [Candidatus Kapabacteria bacterium]HOV92965.1 glycosyltransferase [Candidatus Kapabacteria bacterium]
MADIPPNRIIFNERLNGGFSNKKASGSLPDPLPFPLFLNLGCGNDVRENFLNIDLFSDNPNVICMDIRSLSLPDNCADLILASDILEHFSHRDTEKILAEWTRVLKPSSEIIIRSPSLKKQAQTYLQGTWDADTVSYMIYGGQTNPGDYHCVGFDRDFISKLFSTVGLELVFFEEEETSPDRGFININFIARGKKIPQGFVPQNIEKNIKKEFNTENLTEQSEYDLQLLEEVIDYKENKQSESQTIPSDIENHFHPQLNIVWEGSQFVYHSLALINREHCSNIIDSGVANLTIVPYETDQFSYEISEKYRKLAQNDIRYKPEVSQETSRLPYIWIRHQWPPKAQPPAGAKWIIMQPWEFTQLTKEIASIFKNADQIWTPSNYSRQCIIESGIDFNKVQIVPNGIDPVLFTPEGNKYPIKTSKKLKFLYVGGTTYRKGIDILLQSYIKSFTSEDDVCLIIKDMGSESFYKGQTAENMIHNIQSNPKSPEIIYINDYLTEQEIASLYRSCNVFVSPYRGEGFSLPTLEAMACGLPVIVSNGGATEDFVRDEFAWKIDTEPKTIGNILDGKELTGEAFLLEPDVEHLSDILKSIYNTPSIILQMGLMASAYARKYWNWRRASLKMFSLIDQFYNTTVRFEADKKLPEYNDNYISLGIVEYYFTQEEYDKLKQIFENINLDKINNDIYKKHISKRIIQAEIFAQNFDVARVLIQKYQNDYGNDYDLKYISLQLAYLTENSTEGFELNTDLLNNWKYEKYNSTLGFSLDDLLVLGGNLFLSTKENYFDALDVYELALKENPENAEACYGAAIAYYDLGFPEQALKMIDWAIKLRQDWDEAIAFKNIINGK